MRLRDLTPGELCYGDRIVWDDESLSLPVLFVSAQSDTIGSIHLKGAGSVCHVIRLTDRFTVERDESPPVFNFSEPL